MADRINEQLDDMLKYIKKHRSMLPEPSMEELQAYAHGKLEGEAKNRVEEALAFHHHLRLVVNAMRSPDPAVEAGIARARRRLHRKRVSHFQRPVFLHWKLLGPLVAGALLLFLLKTPPSSPKVVWLPHAFHAATSLRANPEMPEQIPALTNRHYKIRIPDDAHAVYLLEVAEDRLRLVRHVAYIDKTLLEGEVAVPQDGSLTFLIALFLKKDYDISQIMENLELLVQGEVLLASLESEERIAQIRNALKGKTRARLWMAFSPLYQVEQQ